MTRHLHDLKAVADAILNEWRGGLRHPQLGRKISIAFPGLPLETYNHAADVAWERLSAAERQEGGAS